MSVDQHFAVHDHWWWWGGFALGLAPAAVFVLSARTAKRRPARTTTPQVVSTEGDDRAAGHKIIAFPRKAVSGPDALEAIHELLCDVIDALSAFHDLHGELARQLSERRFVLALDGLEDAHGHVDYLLEQAERAMELAQDPEV